MNDIWYKLNHLFANKQFTCHIMNIVTLYIIQRYKACVLTLCYEYFGTILNDLFVGRCHELWLETETLILFTTKPTVCTICKIDFAFRAERQDIFWIT